MENIFYLVILCSSIWVFIDAKNIGVKKGLVTGMADMGPVMWLVGCLLLWIVAFPLYLIKRPDFIKAANSSAKESVGMVFCRGCGKEIHSSAQTCPHCGAKQ